MLSVGWLWSVTVGPGAEVMLVESLIGSTFSFGFEDLVRTATGPGGLVIIFVYSFLIAFALPGVSEVVLIASDSLDIGLGLWGTVAVIILVSGVGKAAGSLLAFHIGQEAKDSGMVMRALERSRFDIVEYSRTKTAEIARRYGYVGLALALSVPFFPDTLSIYAFAILERDYLKFAAATFAGSVGRLLITVAASAGVLAIL